MAWDRIWRWYDRAGRLDFAGTMLGWVFDWKTWLFSAMGGGVTLLWAAIDGRSSLDVWLLALMATACMIIIISGVAALWQRVAYVGGERVTARTHFTAPSANQAQVTALTTGPDWPIHDLFTHINPDLLVRVDDGVGDSWDEIGNDIRDHAALGQLKIWGRPVRNELGRMLGEREALRLVEPSYWTTAFFTYNFFDNTAGDAPHTYLEVGRSGVEYTDLRVNRAEASLIWPPSALNALRLKLGSGEEFETRQSSGLYQTNHTFSVCIENRNATRFLSNCKLSLNIANEKGNGRKDYWLEGPFTLNPTEKKFRSIVSYLEPATISEHAGEFIQLHIPVGAGYGVGHGWPWHLPVAGYTFSLHATSLETGPVEVACKIWVDDDQKLHFEKA
jgi:hypothetical protein